MTKFDFIILGVLFVFLLLGFLRGFVTELFEALGIIVAVLWGRILAVKLATLLPASVPEYMRVPLTTFVLSILIIFSIKAIGSAIRKAFVKKSLKGTDHFLGGFMGIGKGVVVVVCIMAVLSLTPLARIMEKVEKPAPVLRWTMKQSKPVIQRYAPKVLNAATQQVQDAMLGAVSASQPEIAAVNIPATIDNLSANLSPADRAEIIKLLRDPAIAGLNMSEAELLRLVQVMRKQQGGKAGK